MDAKAEQRSLNECPLPQPEIKDPLAYVIECDDQIAVLQEQIQDLLARRTEALDYAIKNNITEDSRGKLETTAGRSIRTLNVQRFREVFPEEWEMCCDVERKDIRDRLNRVGEKINLTLVDRLIKKARLMAAPGVVTVTEGQRSYQVVRKK
jgi:hypothetical protein